MRILGLSSETMVAVDQQIDSMQKERLNLIFDSLELPEGQFITGAEAWRMVKDAEKLGVLTCRDGSLS